MSKMTHKLVLEYQPHRDNFISKLSSYLELKVFHEHYRREKMETDSIREESS